MTNQPASINPSHDSDKKVGQTKNTKITDGTKLDPELEKGTLKKTSKQKKTASQSLKGLSAKTKGRKTSNETKTEPSQEKPKTSYYSPSEQATQTPFPSPDMLQTSLSTSNYDALHYLENYINATLKKEFGEHADYLFEDIISHKLSTKNTAQLNTVLRLATNDTRPTQNKVKKQLMADWKESEPSSIIRTLKQPFKSIQLYFKAKRYHKELARNTGPLTNLLKQVLSNYRELYKSKLLAAKVSASKATSNQASETISTAPSTETPRPVQAHATTTTPVATSEPSATEPPSPEPTPTPEPTPAQTEPTVAETPSPEPRPVKTTAPATTTAASEPRTTETPSPEHTPIHTPTLEERANELHAKLDRAISKSKNSTRVKNLHSVKRQLDAILSSKRSVYIQKLHLFLEEDTSTFKSIPEFKTQFTRTMTQYQAELSSDSDAPLSILDKTIQGNPFKLAKLSVANCSISKENNDIELSVQMGSAAIEKGLPEYDLIPLILPDPKTLVAKKGKKIDLSKFIDANRMDKQHQEKLESQIKKSGLLDPSVYTDFYTTVRTQADSILTIREKEAKIIEKETKTIDHEKERIDVSLSKLMEPFRKLDITYQQNPTQAYLESHSKIVDTLNIWREKQLSELAKHYNKSEISKLKTYIQDQEKRAVYTVAAVHYEYLHQQSNQLELPTLSDTNQQQWPQRFEEQASVYSIQMDVLQETIRQHQIPDIAEEKGRATHWVRLGKAFFDQYLSKNKNANTVELQSLDQNEDTVTHKVSTDNISRVACLLLLKEMAISNDMMIDTSGDTPEIDIKEDFSLVLSQTYNTPTKKDALLDTVLSTLTPQLLGNISLTDKNLIQGIETATKASLIGPLAHYLDLLLTESTEKVTEFLEEQLLTK